MDAGGEVLGGIQLRKGRLHAVSKASAAALDRALRRAGTTETADILSSQSNQERCIMRSTPFDDTMICMSLQPVDDDSHRPALPDLTYAFGLTPSEAAVVIDICSGYTPQDIADRNNISIHTVRAHLRHCYGKLGVTCREELWHKLRHYLIS